MTIKDARGIADQTQSGEGYSRTEFRESERVHEHRKADTDTEEEKQTILSDRQRLQKKFGNQP